LKSKAASLFETSGNLPPQLGTNGWIAKGVFVNHLCEAKSEQDGEADKLQESFGELVIASGDAPMALDSFEEVFYPVTTSVEPCGEWHGRGAVTATWDAGVYSFRGRCLPEGRAIIGFVFRWSVINASSSISRPRRQAAISSPGSRSPRAKGGRNVAKI
jgi:hypothetical protein